MLRSSLIALATLVVAGCGSSHQDASVQIGLWRAQTPPLSAIPPAPAVRPVAEFVKAAAATQPQVPAGTTPAAAAGADGGAPQQAASSTGVAAGAPSDAEVARELRAAYGDKGSTAASLIDRAGISGGLATIPPTAPPKVAAVISAANSVARYPYVYGGGHGTFEDSAYDCSGSVSFALAAAGMLHTTLVSGQFESWGAAGPGKWITIYANATHAWMTVAGLRYDTGGLLTPTHSRWQATMRPTTGFVVRHPIGL